MIATIPLGGRCDARFAGVREAFAENFAAAAEVGAALAVMVAGEVVVDLWGGWQDAAKTRPWERDTIVAQYSVGKGVTAVCLWRLAEQGGIDIDAPVARYWPEFAQAGKERIPVRWLLTHQAGLPAIRAPLPAGTWRDWDAMCAALAAQEPWWEPGTTHGYHMNTQGHLAGEVIRRVTGRSIGAYLREAIGVPAGIDFQFGTPPDDDARTADWLPMMTAAPDTQRAPSNPLQALAGRNPPGITGGADGVNSRAWRAAEIPSCNGHGNARALARLYGAIAHDGLLEDVPILSPATAAEAAREQVYGQDRVLGRVTRFGSGFQLTMQERPLGPNAGAFGHFGAGGGLGFADPEAALGFGYVMNQGRGGWQHRHVRRLIDLVYDALR